MFTLAMVSISTVVSLMYMPHIYTAVLKIRITIHRSDVQVTFELYSEIFTGLFFFKQNYIYWVLPYSVDFKFPREH